MEDGVCIRLEIDLTDDLEGLFPYGQALVSEVVVEDALPYLRGTFFAEYLLDNVADDETSQGVEIIVEEQDLTRSLVLNLLRFLA